MAEKAIVVAQEENDRLITRIHKFRKESEAMTKQAISSVAALGSAYGVGYVKGRYPDKATVFGHDISAVASVAGFVASMTGVLGKESYIAHAIGMGTGGKWLGDKGEVKGKEDATK